MTLPLLRALNRAEPDDHQFLARLLAASPAERKERQEEAGEIIAKNHGFTDARARAEELINEARRCLEIFPDSEAKGLLMGLASYVLSRDK